MIQKLSFNTLLIQISKKILILFISCLSLSSYSANTSSVMSDFSFQDTMADNVYQQIVNGTYRTVELLNLIAQK